MSKPTTTSSPLEREFSDEWADHPIVDWLSANRQILLWVFVGLFVALLISYRYLSVQNLNAENDFFQAENAFLQIQQGTDSNAAALRLQELTAIMARHPELHAKYDASLAQILLIQGQIPEAKALAQSTFKRVRPDELALYEQYAKTSLLIGEGLYAEALQRSIQLQIQLTQQADGASTTLPTYNLLRLALLYQQLHQSQEELAAWNTLLQQTEDGVQDVLATYQLFQTGQTSLGHYIAERKKALAL